MMSKTSMKWFSQQWRTFIPLVIGALLLLAIVFVEPRTFANFSGTTNNQNELRLELTSGGFVPGNAQHAAGTFEITVENSVISGEYTLILKAADGGVLKELQVQKGSAAWTVTLNAGQYTLTEASHPQWLCQITVQ